MLATVRDRLRNRLLAALPQPDFAAIARHLATASMPPGHILDEADNSVRQSSLSTERHAFPALSVLRNGKTRRTFDDFRFHAQKRKSSMRSHGASGAIRPATYLFGYAVKM
jgi:hypothetical protein